MVAHRLQPRGGGLRRAKRPRSTSAVSANSDTSPNSGATTATAHAPESAPAAHAPTATNPSRSRTSYQSPKTRTHQLTQTDSPTMLADTSRWSHARDNTVVPSPWQATAAIALSAAHPRLFPRPAAEGAVACSAVTVRVITAWSPQRHRPRPDDEILLAADHHPGPTCTGPTVTLTLDNPPHWNTPQPHR